MRLFKLNTRWQLLRHALSDGFKCVTTTTVERKVFFYFWFGGALFGNHLVMFTFFKLCGLCHWQQQCHSQYCEKLFHRLISLKRLLPAGMLSNSANPALHSFYLIHAD